MISSKKCTGKGTDTYRERTVSRGSSLSPSSVSTSAILHLTVTDFGSWGTHDPCHVRDTRGADSTNRNTKRAGGPSRTWVPMRERGMLFCRFLWLFSYPELRRSHQTGPSFRSADIVDWFAWSFIAVIWTMRYSSSLRKSSSLCTAAGEQIANPAPWPTRAALSLAALQQAHVEI